MVRDGRRLEHLRLEASTLTQGLARPGSRNPFQAAVGMLHDGKGGYRYIPRKLILQRVDQARAGSTLDIYGQVFVHCTRQLCARSGGFQI